jgi:hypothetical protein
MNWFDIYLAIGVAVTVWAYGSHQLDSPRRSRFVRDVEAAMYPERAKLGYRSRAYLLAPVLTVVSVVTLWPIALVMHLKGLREKRWADEADPASSDSAQMITLNPIQGPCMLGQRVQ